MQVRRSRTGVGTILLGGAYAAFGLFWGVWGVTFADFVAHRALTLGRAGTYLAVLSAASVVMMTLVAQHLESTPRHRTVALSVASCGVGVLLLGVAPDSVVVAAFVVTGVGTGLTDVFVNAAGQEFEARKTAPILQRLHAAYSFGGAVGALAAGVGLSIGVRYEWLLTASAVALVVAAIGNASRSYDGRTAEPALPSVLPDPPVLPSADPGSAAIEPAEDPETDGTEADVIEPEEAMELTGARPGPVPRARRHRTSLSIFLTAPFLLVPGVALAAGYFVEGSLDVWSVIYLREALGASPLVGAMGLVAFNLALGFGRLFAARLLFGLGYRLTLLLSGFASLGAGSVAVVVGHPAAVSVALLVMGFCIAATGPAAIGMVGRAGADVATAVAAISTLGYAGFIFGPPLLGWLADGVGLQAAMAAVVAGTLGIVAAGVMTRAAASDREAGA